MVTISGESAAHRLWWNIASTPQVLGVIHLRRSTPISWRKLAVAGIAGIATTLAFASPAAACYPVFKGAKAQCVSETTATVAWTVSSDTAGATLQTSTFTIDGQAATGSAPAGLGNGNELPDKSAFTLTVPNTAKRAELAVGLSADDGTNTGVLSQEIDLTQIDWSKCKKTESASPSTSASPSAPASPTASNGSGVAGASSSAAGSLPVTGASAGIIAGVAVVLLAAGAGLFMMARRRRIRFTTA